MPGPALRPEPAAAAVSRGDSPPVAHDDGFFDGMLQFADVTRPRVFVHFAHRCLVETLDRFVVLRGVAFEEHFRQRQDVFAALPQGGRSIWIVLMR